MLENFHKNSMKLVLSAKKRAKKPIRRSVCPLDILLAFFEIEDETKNFLINLGLSEEKILNTYEEINTKYPKTKEPFSKEVIKIFLSSLKIINKNKEDQICPIHLLSAIFDEQDPILKELFNKLKLNEKEITNTLYKKIKKSKQIASFVEYKVFNNYSKTVSRKNALKQQYFFLLKLFRKI